MKNLTRQNPGQLFVAQELINKVIKLNYSVAELRVSQVESENKRKRSRHAPEGQRAHSPGHRPGHSMKR